MPGGGPGGPAKLGHPVTNMNSFGNHVEISTGARCACPGCGERGAAALYALEGIPAQSTLLVRSRAEALAFPQGALELRWCPACGLAFNAAFDPARVAYDAGYEDAQGSSPTFVRFATGLARGWIERYRLQGRHLVEIGCGKGEFLRLMVAEAGCTGLGLDPAFVPGREPDPPGVAFRAESFSEAHVPLDADFVICRHTLEHVGDVAGFLKLLRRACGARREIRLGFEVPDLGRILAEGAFWDVYYEHSSYFTAGALGRAFESAGFDVLDVRREYGDQYLVLEAAPAAEGQGRLPPAADDLAATAALVEGFRARARAAIAGWRAAFAAWAAEGRRVALWGSGSKAVGFLTTIGDPGIVAAVVDINPVRQGRFMPGCAMPIVAPADLPAHRPDIVLVMNPLYRDEIAAEIDAMRLAPEIMTVEAAPEPRP